MCADVFAHLLNHLFVESPPSRCVREPPKDGPDLVMEHRTLALDLMVGMEADLLRPLWPAAADVKTHDVDQIKEGVFVEALVQIAGERLIKESFRFAQVAERFKKAGSGVG
jgi:hypothetical protein